MNFTIRLFCLLVAARIMPAGAEKVIQSFSNFPHGANPYAPLSRDKAGNLYGTTCQGGQFNYGVVFRLNPSGTHTVLYNFTNGADGGCPYGGSIGNAAGYLYGTTNQGGTANLGVVFQLDPSGHETVLHSFAGGSDGASPYAGVIADKAGNLYGTTYHGGTANAGTVYKVTPSGQETVLHSFTGGADGGKPYAGLIFDAAGNLYGTTYAGGATGEGTIYKVSPAGKETVLHSFSPQVGGANPYAGVIGDGAGNLYGVTSAASAAEIYELSPSGTFTVLYQFPYDVGPGTPEGGLVRDAEGNLYGTTQHDSAGGEGAVWKLDSGGQLQVLYVYPGASGGLLPPNGPNPGLIADSEGNLYGVTANGGVGGLIFKLNPSDQETTLYSFSGAPGGTRPFEGLIGDLANNIYGTTYQGGAANAGVLYKMTSAGHETILYSFMGGADGANPTSGVAVDSAGNVYGTAERGGSAAGAAGFGLVYRVDPAGKQTVLYTFTGGADGGGPAAGVILDTAGNLYGTTFLGGSAGAGVVFKVSDTGQETVLHSFTNGTDGGYPKAGVIRDGSGNLYGTTSSGGQGFGTVYKVDPAGNETVLHSFGLGGGQNPYGGVIRDSSGSLYGTTANGGVSGSGSGVVFEVGPSGQYKVLYTFTGGVDGGLPEAGVIVDSSGNLYGTTLGGGISGCGGAGCGVVYKIDPSGHETVLYSFTGGADGANPEASLIMDSAGNLYGTTPYGGKGGAASAPDSGGGVVFEITTQ